jgi:nucleotide-binding universal stress UspA family protein
MNRPIKLRKNFRGKPHPKLKAASVKPDVVANGKPGLQFQSILVPVDFSEPSQDALAKAEAIAKRFGARLRLVHVVEPPKVFSEKKPPYGIWDQYVIDVAREKLTGLAVEKIDDLIPVDCDIRMGRPHRRICDAAVAFNSDLIVIATHGRTGLKHLFMGSTAEKVVQRAPCPVLVIRQGATENRSFAPKKILVPIDFSAGSRWALHCALDLATRFDADVEAVNVIPVYYPIDSYATVDLGLLQAELQQASEKEFARLLAELRRREPALRTFVRHGRPATEIVEAAKEIKADLIVISTHGRTGLDHLLLGSTAEEVVRHAGCPVLVAREKSKTNLNIYDRLPQSGVIAG